MESLYVVTPWLRCNKRNRKAIVEFLLACRTYSERLCYIKSPYLGTRHWFLNLPSSAPQTRHPGEWFSHSSVSSVSSLVKLSSIHFTRQSMRIQRWVYGKRFIITGSGKPRSNSCIISKELSLFIVIVQLLGKHEYTLRWALKSSSEWGLRLQTEACAGGVMDGITRMMCLTNSKTSSHSLLGTKDRTSSCLGFCGFRSDF